MIVKYYELIKIKRVWGKNRWDISLKFSKKFLIKNCAKERERKRESDNKIEMNEGWKISKWNFS